MTYEEKLRRLANVIIIELVGLILVILIWLLFTVVADNWSFISSKPYYLMLWGYIGGLISLLGRIYFNKLVYRKNENKNNHDLVDNIQFKNGKPATHQDAPHW